MKNAPKILSLFLAGTVLCTTLAACNSTPAQSQSTSTAGSSQQSAPVEGGQKNFEGITVNYASCFNESEQHSVWIKELAEQWNKETGGTLKFNFAGRDVLTAVKSDILTGNAPDIIDGDMSELSAAFLTENEVLLDPLADVLAAPAYGESIALNENINGAYKMYSHKDNDYFVPFIYITSGFFYNKTMFNELNLTVPATWEQFVDVCEKLKAADIAPLAADGNISFYNCYYFQSLVQRIMGSGQLLNAALDKSGAAWDNVGFLQAAQKVEEISAKGKNYFQDGYAGNAYPAGQSDWAMGGAGMLYCGTWIPLETGDLADEDFEYGFFPFPTIEGGSGKVTDIEAQLMTFCVPKDAKNKEAAKDFLAFCSNKVAADRLVELTDNMSARTDAIYPEALRDVKPTVDAATEYHKNWDGAMSAAPEWWANVFYPADNALFFGKISAEEFIKQIKDESIKFYANKN